MVPQQSKNDSAMFSKQCGAKRLHKVQVDIVSGINEIKGNKRERKRKVTER